MRNIRISLVRNSAMIAIGTFFVSVAVIAATTIGSNISTGGTLDVTGLSTFDRATSTSATTTAYLYVGFDITEPSGWDFSGGDLLVSGDAFFNSKATSSVSHWIGSGGTINWLDVTGGDLFVQDDIEIDGTLFFNNATGTSATTTAYLYIGPDITEPSGWDFSGGDLLVSGDAFFNSKATSTSSFWVGSGGTINWLDLSGGDLFVQDDIEIDGTLFFNNATGTSATTTSYLMVGDGSPTFDYTGDLWVKDALEVGGKATSTGDFIVGSETVTATTSIKIKSDASGLNGASCIEWVNIEDVIYREYINAAGTKVLETGNCS